MAEAERRTACDEIEPLLSAFVLGELESAGAEGHEAGRAEVDPAGADRAETNSADADRSAADPTRADPTGAGRTGGDRADAGRVREHLEGCAACRAERDAIARTARLLAACPPPELSSIEVLPGETGEAGETGRESPIRRTVLAEARRRAERASPEARRQRLVRRVAAAATLAFGGLIAVATVEMLRTGTRGVVRGPELAMDERVAGTRSSARGFDAGEPAAPALRERSAKLERGAGPDGALPHGASQDTSGPLPGPFDSAKRMGVGADDSGTRAGPRSVTPAAAAEPAAALPDLNMTRRDFAGASRPAAGPPGALPATGGGKELSPRGAETLGASGRAAGAYGVRAGEAVAGIAREKLAEASIPSDGRFAFPDDDSWSKARSRSGDPADAGGVAWPEPATALTERVTAGSLSDAAPLPGADERLAREREARLELVTSARSRSQNNPGDDEARKRSEEARLLAGARAGAVPPVQPLIRILPEGATVVQAVPEASAAPLGAAAGAPPADPDRPIRATRGLSGEPGNARPEGPDPPPELFESPPRQDASRVAAPGDAPGASSAGPAESEPPPAPDYRARVDELLSRLDRRPGETPGMMFFRYWGTNPFVDAETDRLSTFAVDCDTASYTLMRAYLGERGILPPPEAVRTEEFINYFKGRYAPPTEEGRAFAIHVEGAPSPFAHEPGYRLLRVGLKGREVSRAERKACALVFVVDTSGSMRQGGRLELVKDALRLLVAGLDEGDTIGIVAFSTTAREVLEPAPASERERILDAIGLLHPEQTTNVGQGLELGYAMAARRPIAGGSNRVILLSDGVANTGVTDPASMLERVRSERERGIYLTVVGVGMGNHNDAILEQLADRGNGQCHYVDRIDEARKLFVEGLTGTLETIARDVKVQVEFDPKRVIRYRLLGYENRDIADASFRDNKVDAGEVGAGHEVTALYELKPRDPEPGQDAAGPLATVRVRYLTVDHGEAVEHERPVGPECFRDAFEKAPPVFRLAACAAEFAEVLRDSYWARGSTLDRVAGILESILPEPAADGGPRLGDDASVVELVALVKRADALVRQRRAERDEIALAIDAAKENRYLRVRIEEELRRRGDERREAIEDLQRQNDALRRRLEELLSR